MLSDDIKNRFSEALELLKKNLKFETGYTREQGLERERLLIESNHKREAELRSQVIGPKVESAPPPPTIEMYPVGGSKTEPTYAHVDSELMRVGDRITIRGTSVTRPFTIAPEVANKKKYMKELARLGDWPEFQRYGGSSEDFRFIRTNGHWKDETC